MIAVQDPRPAHRPGAAAGPVKALSMALHTLRHVQDEQTRVRQAFYRIGTWDTRPRTGGPARRGVRPLRPAGSKHRAASQLTARHKDANVHRPGWASNGARTGRSPLLGQSCRI